jgi:cell division protein FtsI/penicillin-binding protein 2
VSPSRWLGSLAIAALLLAAPARAASRVDLRHAVVTGDHVVAPAGSGRVALTLDPRLQRAATRLLASSGSHEGAIVASDVRTGRVLAWASRGDRDYVASAFAPSASLFKLVTATALLEDGAVKPESRVCYAGGEHTITRRDVEGPLRGGVECTRFGDALGKSINLVFARLAKQHLASAELERRAAELGFAGEVPIDVPVEASHVHVPTDPFGLARAAAGFWNGTLTPLGALFAMQTIARGGERLPLRVLASSPAPAPRGRAMSAETAATLQSMLEVTTKRGTCARAFRKPDGTRALADVGVAAKTGTLVGGTPSRMFSWFAAFAPSARPEIAVAVMLGNDVTWRTKANLVGRALLEAYFEPNAPKATAKHRPASTRRR